MIDYLYDGSFEGFLTCVHRHYYGEKAAGIYPADSYQTSLMQPSLWVETDEEKAALVYKAIETKISPHALGCVYRVFLSGLENKDNIAFRYILLGFRVGPGVSSLHSHPAVFEAERTARKVFGEAHRLCGLVRFSVVQVDGAEGAMQALYSRIEPDHNVLEILADHFSDRFKSEAFVIHDTRREKGLFSTLGSWYIAPLPREASPSLSGEELEYRRLWRRYFDTIAIEKRKNPRCQKSFMPVRYWKNLTEIRPGGWD